MARKIVAGYAKEASVQKLLAHAIDKITALAINLTRDEAMDIGLEARKSLIEITGE
ncbi:MAG: hypothetical protein ACI8WM_002433, partial [Burkholderiaceae bacterium]